MPAWRNVWAPNAAAKRGASIMSKWPQPRIFKLSSKGRRHEQVIDALDHSLQKMRWDEMAFTSCRRKSWPLGDHWWPLGDLWVTFGCSELVDDVGGGCGRVYNQWTEFFHKIMKMYPYNYSRRDIDKSTHNRDFVLLTLGNSTNF